MRLTESDLNKVNYDPWELCGMDNYCQKGCHEDGGCTKGCHILKMYKKLAKYEDLEEQGLLLKLPCKADTTVYYIMTSLKGTNPMIFTQNFDYSMIEYFGQTVFLTQEEAEEALKKMKSEE